MNVRHPCFRFRALLAVLAISACAPLPPTTATGAAWVPSPNFDERKPNLVVIHYTSDDTVAEALHTLTSAERKVSAHYLIGRDGSVIELVAESARAWHAGKSWWSGVTDVNSASLGIELDNNGREAFPDAQIDALITLLAGLRQRYNIPAANFVGHADIAPTRKEDPGELFPWQRLAQQGFGLWCDAPLPPPPPGFDLTLALTAMGYSPATPEASLKAFRTHFVRAEQEDTPEFESAMAFCLLKKKMQLSQ